jgi:hypothetical protein
VLEVREPDNRFSEGIGAFHGLSMRSFTQSVKYVIAICR